MAGYALDGVLQSVGSVGDMIAVAVERHGPCTAFVCGERHVTYQEFGEDISRAMQFLAGLGLRTGDAVMQISANSYEMVVVMTACYLGGLMSVTPGYGNSEDDHRYVLDDCGATVLLVDAPRAGRAQAIAAGRNDVRVFALQAGTGLEPAWPAMQAYDPAPLVPADRPQDIVRLIYTGGTTGRPKGVVTLSSQLAFASLLHMAEQGFTGATRMLVLSPISHGAGSFILPVLSKGGCVVIQDGFDVGAVLDAVARLRVTAVFLVPTMLYVLMDDPRTAAAEFGALTRIIYAASPIAPPRVAQALAMFGPILSQNYGLTEVPGTVLTLTPEDHVDARASRLASAGKPYPGVTVRLLDDAGELVAPGAVGEICVRAPHATPGYWNQPELTAQLWRDGWLHTGDMAYQGPDGYFQIVDRKKDMIVSGGFNIYPQEVEHALGDHPAVAAAAVIGVPHPKWGEAVHAAVVLKVGQGVSEADLIDWVRHRKGAVMAPKTVAFMAGLPLTRLGKIDKKTLRAPFWAGQARAVG